MPWILSFFDAILVLVSCSGRNLGSSKTSLPPLHPPQLELAGKATPAPAGFSCLAPAQGRCQQRQFKARLGSNVHAGQGKKVQERRQPPRDR
ncbi:hypothetical protein F5X96DRAFT_661930 [Biscogniauxia mediterranea]|nr:hypothetical protein F5X96DRAFT_661930 [Biscogniauxia mediterranea]